MLPFAKRLIYLFAGILILSLTGCASSNDGLPVTGDGETPETQTDLVNTYWRLVSYGETGSETQVAEGTDVTLQFEDDGQAGGSGGCNTFGAQYEIKAGGGISITDVVSTLMACTNENLMDQESQYFDALQSANSYEVLGEDLTIQYDNGKVLNFLRITSGTPSSLNI